MSASTKCFERNSACSDDDDDDDAGGDDAQDDDDDDKLPYIIRNSNYTHESIFAFIMTQAISNEVVDTL